MAEICTDSFLINMVGNLLCTLRLKNREDVKAVYGIVNYTKRFLYTPGTGVNTTHPLYGFHATYNPAPTDANFPPGVTLGGNFAGPPDLSGNFNAPREGIFNGTVAMDRATYPGSSDPRYVKSVRATITFNPGV